MKIYVKFPGRRIARKDVRLMTEEDIKDYLKTRRAEGQSIYIGELGFPNDELRKLDKNELIALGASGGTWNEYYDANMKANAGVYRAGWTWPKYPNYL